MFERMGMRLPPRIETWWADARTTLWFLPTFAAVAGVVLSLLVVWIDHRLDFTESGVTSPWLFGAGANGARGVLVAIAGSLMTVIGTVFSITIVALQLAASQFTPRVLRQFTGDRINQSVLAAFIGTFIYCLLVLRTVRDATDVGTTAFVPVVGVTVAIVLALVCIALLILFLHHMTQQTQVSYILARASADALALIDAYFRERIDVAPALVRRDYAQGDGHDVLSRSSGYLQQYDHDYLLETARDHHLTIRMLVPMGAYLNTGQAIARVWAAESDVEDLKKLDGAILAAFFTGPERTLYADLPLGVRQIVDIALKALSAAINDPTTATQAIDRIGEVLVRAGTLESPEQILYVDDRPAVFLPRIGFDELTQIAFTQVRHYAQQDVVVMLHLAHTIERVASLVDLHHHRVLLRHLELVRATGEQGLMLGPDRQALCDAVDGAIARIRDYRSRERPPVVPDIVQKI